MVGVEDYFSSEASAFLVEKNIVSTLLWSAIASQGCMTNHGLPTESWIWVKKGTNSYTKKTV